MLGWRTTRFRLIDDRLISDRCFGKCLQEVGDKSGSQVLQLLKQGSDFGALIKDETAIASKRSRNDHLFQGFECLLGLT